MRTIKFRVWDKAKRIMISALELTNKGYLIRANLENRTSENILWLQFTGLHDKNGKEIFEGDVVKWGMHKGSEEYFHRYAVVDFNPDIQFRILFYINSQTGEMKPTDNYIFRFGNFAYKETEKHIEIIGNVFENPDLVKL